MRGEMTADETSGDSGPMGERIPSMPDLSGMVLEDAEEAINGLLAPLRIGFDFSAKGPGDVVIRRPYRRRYKVDTTTPKPGVPVLGATQVVAQIVVQTQ